jgi:hypothetical protein
LPSIFSTWARTVSRHAVHEHFEVQLAHAGDLGLAGLIVGADLEGGVLLGQAAERDRHLLLVGLRLGLDSDLDHGLGKDDVLEVDRVSGVRQRVAGDDLLDADGRGDVARVYLGDLLALVGVHHQDAPDALGAPRADVQDLRARLQVSGVDAEVGELADVGVRRDLEGEGRERLGVVRVTHDITRLLLAFDQFGAADGGHVQGRGQVVDDRVEQGLDALVLERRAAQDGGQLGGEGRLADRALERLLGHVRLLEDQLEQDVVVVGDLLEQVFARGGGRFLEVLRDLDLFLFLAHVVVVDDRFHRDQVDDAEEVPLRADRQLDRHRVRGEAVDHRLHALVEVRADAVHLVDVRDAGHVVLVGLAPDGLGLRLDAGD